MEGGGVLTSGLPIWQPSPSTQISAKSLRRTSVTPWHAQGMPKGQRPEVRGQRLVWRGGGLDLWPTHLAAVALHTNLRDLDFVKFRQPFTQCNGRPVS